MTRSLLLAMTLVASAGCGFVAQPKQQTAPAATEAAPAEDASQDGRSWWVLRSAEPQPVAFAPNRRALHTFEDAPSPEVDEHGTPGDAPPALIRIGKRGVVIPGVLRVDDDGVFLNNGLSVTDDGIVIPGVLRIDDDGVVIHGGRSKTRRPADPFAPAPRRTRSF